MKRLVPATKELKFAAASAAAQPYQCCKSFGVFNFMPEARWRITVNYSVLLRQRRHHYDYDCY
eukprot:928639-Pyramimonas_sp.AAC.1